MSVKISRREERRDTSIRDFSLAAVLPLLLTGLLGYFIGQAGKTDVRVSGSELSLLQDSLTTAKAQLTEQTWLFHEIDSLLEAFSATRQRRLEEFAALEVPGGGEVLFDDPHASWLRKVTTDFNHVSDALSELQGTIDGRKVIADASVEPVFALFRELNQQSNRYFRLRSNAYRSQTTEQRDLTEKLTDNQSDYEDRIDELNGKLALLEIKLANKTELNEILQTKLSVADAPVIADVETISYATQKGTINSSIIEIQAISQQIPSGVLVKRRDKEEIEAKIMREIGKIQNALATIE